MMCRWTVLKGAMAAAAYVCGMRTASAAILELRLADTAASERWDFETKGIDGWSVVDGQSAVARIARLQGAEQSA